MKKYIPSFVLIIIGFILLIYIYVENNKIEYSETIFSNEAKSFNEFFSGFIANVEQDFRTIQSSFEDTNKIKDTIKSKNFFLDYLSKNPYLISAGLFQDNYKVFVKRDKKTLIYAIDSTKEFDVIRWQRFADKKFISSYDESFAESIEQTPWYSELNDNYNQIRWFLNNDKNIDNASVDNDELFYAGYSYKIDDVKKIILLRFSRQKLVENFNFYKKYNNVGLIIETEPGIIMDLVSKGFKNMNSEIVKNDSINIHTLVHFKRFDKKSSGVFKFNFKNEDYWNSFQRFPSKVGINYYLLTISDTDLKQGQISNYTTFLIWLAVLVVFLGLVLILIKKGIFYKKLNFDIPPLDEILKEDENRFLEFKSSARWDYRQEKVNPVLEKVILKTIAAFGNTDGGILLIGVNDDNKIIGLEKDFNSLKKSTPDYYEIHLRNLFHKFMGVKYVSKNIRIQFEQFEDKYVCKIKVFAANEPLFIKSKNKNGQEVEQFFVRSGNSSQEIKSIPEINDYINSKFKG